MSRKTFFTIVKYVLGLALGGLLMWLAMRGIDFTQVEQGFKDANYLWVAIGLAVAILSHWYRAVRWKLLIEAAGYKSNAWNLFCSIMVGYLVNQALSRVGEVTRATMTAKSEKIPLSVSFGTMVTDRVFDVIALGLLVLGVFLFQFKEIMAIMDKAFANNAPATMNEESIPWKLIFGITFAVGMLVLIIFWKRFMRIALFAKGVAFSKDIWLAVKSVTKMKRPWLFLYQTVMIWVCYILMTYLVFFALKDTSGLSFTFAITAFTMGGIGMVMPSPGGIGTYHFAIIMSFTAYASSFGWTEDFAKVVGTNIAFIIHTSQFIMMIVAGVICYLFLLPKMKIGEGKPEQKLDKELASAEN
ncbi:MAG: flippase-like domain-containing protein [Bacteroidetes bacterium]|nr:flippase-like domain-containing protein [Bacteroidota bacterium]MBL0017793.1 flippase-like domain-containing protein [Bacteroidota bacterium]